MAEATVEIGREKVTGGELSLCVRVRSERLYACCALQCLDQKNRARAAQRLLLQSRHGTIEQAVTKDLSQLGVLKMPEKHINHTADPVDQ